MITGNTSAHPAIEAGAIDREQMDCPSTPQNLDDPHHEADLHHRALAAKVVGEHPYGGVGEEHGNEVRDNHDGRLECQQGKHREELTDGTPHEAKDHGIR